MTSFRSDVKAAAAPDERQQGLDLVAANRTSFRLQGAGRIAIVGNGDPASREAHKLPHRKAAASTSFAVSACLRSGA